MLPVMQSILGTVLDAVCGCSLDGDYGEGRRQTRVSAPVEEC